MVGSLFIWKSLETKRRTTDDLPTAACIQFSTPRRPHREGIQVISGEEEEED